MSVRIIGGKWRGRKARFPELPGIRPTPDRVRETLFNWLMQDIAGSRCLDLYAGSGALGIEALSRGASHLVFVDSDARTTGAIADNLNAFGAPASTYQIVTRSAPEWLEETSETFDIVFMDPPFSKEDWPTTCGLLAERQLCDGLVYLETSREVREEELPENWSIHRQKQAGAVHFCLCHAVDIS